MVLNFAHRGSLTEAPENSIPAFQKALEHGTQAIELDVQLTKDNQLVICHDHKFTRYNNQVKGRIKDYTLHEIKQIDISAAFGTAYKGTSLPTLQEVLDLCPKDIILNIEIKNIPVIYDGIEKILIDCLRANNRLENILISSFDHLALQKVQALEPGLELGMLFYYRMLRPWEYAKQSGLRISNIHPNQVYTDQEFVESCKAHGFKVYPYTVNDTKRYEQLLDFEVDGVFSNNPAIFRADK
ncbi:glycerophosphodiester phosphodiesterase [Virgibacillus sp. MG-45]|uniref:glycerophosphodiester phosphodiesterase n=1 Tax=Virgibacillus sp. MG-45 TaxID=3102791 RepID=UPI002EDB4A06